MLPPPPSFISSQTPCPSSVPWHMQEAPQGTRCSQPHLDALSMRIIEGRSMPRACLPVVHCQLSFSPILADLETVRLLSRPRGPLPAANSANTIWTGPSGRYVLDVSCSFWCGLQYAGQDQQHRYDHSAIQVNSGLRSEIPAFPVASGCESSAMVTPGFCSLPTVANQGTMSSTVGGQSYQGPFPTPQVNQMQNALPAPHRGSVQPPAVSMPHGKSIERLRSEYPLMRHYPCSRVGLPKCDWDNVPRE